VVFCVVVHLMLSALSAVSADWCGWPAASAMAGTEVERPNVVFLFSDDQRPDTIAALGNDVIETPNLDRLVERGTVFTRAVASNPLCVPSRAEVLTGRTSYRNGVNYHNGWRFEGERPKWPAMMRKAGYRTGYVGKWMTEGRPDDHGYEEAGGLFASGGGSWEQMEYKEDYRGTPVTGYRGWTFQSMDGSDQYPDQGVGLTPEIDRKFADAAIDFLEREPDEPFFLHVNFTAPHDPLLIPSGYEDMYDPADIPVPENFKPRHPFDHGNIDGRDEQLLPFPRTKRMIREDLAAYYTVISHLDEQVGRILDFLEATGQAERTIIIFSSDHGLAMGSHGLRGKQNMYEHTVGVPLIFAGPGIPEGERRDAQTYLYDLFPTICDLAGIEPPDGLDGRSVAPVIRGEKESVRDYVFAYFKGSQRMIRGDRWKLIEYPQVGRTQLFGLQNDPHELHNLADDPEHEDVRKKLRDKLESWRRRQGDPLLQE